MKDLHSGPQQSVCHNEAGHQILAEAGARRSVEEGCNESQSHRHRVSGDHSHGSWKEREADCRGSTVAGHTEACCSRRAS